MAEEPGGRRFPFYIKTHPQNADFLTWIGKYLTEKRRSKSITKVAKAAGTPTESIEKLEKGGIRA